MQTFDFAPLFRSTVGFDRLAQLLDGVSNFDATANTYPPYNIERTGDNAYRITVAVAGFTEAELKLEVKEQVLSVTGEKLQDATAKDRQFLHRGIAGRAFDRRFQLADHVEVQGAALADGLLHIDLVRNVPERLKPRQIAIGQGAAAPAKQLQAAE
jgi:molecular chaperone IbpA